MYRNAVNIPFRNTCSRYLYSPTGLDLNLLDKGRCKYEPLTATEIEEL